MINIKINDRIYEFPGSWNELNQEELLFLCTRILRKESISMLKITMTLLLLKLRIVKKDSQVINDVEYFTVIDPARNIFDISSVAIDQVSEKLSFLFGEREDEHKQKQLYIESRLTKNLIPEITLGQHEFTGPKQALSDISFHQFILTEHHYNRYLNRQDYTALDKLIAILYPRTGEKFNETNVSPDAAILTALAMSRKLAVKLYYEGSKKYLAEKFPLVFSGKKAGNLSIVDGYMKVINSLSGNDVTKHDEIRATQLYEVLYAMNDLIEKNEKIPA